jgi:hypothetical protein
MPETYEEIEERLKRAVEGFYAIPGRSVAFVACRYNVPYDALRQRLHGRPSKQGFGGKTKALTTEQEKALVLTLELLERNGLNARLSMI